MSPLLTFLSAALVSSVAAFAQSADTLGTAPATGSPRAVAPAPIGGGGANHGSSRVVLLGFGPYVTQASGGAGGAPISELYTTVGYSTYGFGWQDALGHSIADDFTVPAGSYWNPDTIKWLGYQTSGGTAGSFSGLFLNVWTSDPLGQPRGGQAFTGGNQLTSQVWTGVYRVSDTDPHNVSRPIIEISAGGAWIPVLAPGTYWIEASATGTAVSGPWAPPVTLPGQVPPTLPPHNGRQLLPVSSGGTGLFTAVTDGGSLDTIGFLFQIEGPTCGGSVSCASEPTSVPGCVPALTGPCAVVKGGVGSIAFCSPTPGAAGGGGGLGLLIYSDQGGPVGLPGPYGQLCVGGSGSYGVRRGICTVVGSGGTYPLCNGQLDFDLQCLVNSSPWATAGTALFIQAWYRDNPKPSGANLTNAWGPIAVL